MVDVHLQVPTALSDYIQSQIAMGRYANVDDYMRDLISADQKQQQLIAEMEIGGRLTQLLLDGLEGGEGRVWTSEVLAQLKRGIASRNAEAVE
jgi:Arc/MetJ-type ribon-helix-helix transcriptional regulator